MAKKVKITNESEFGSVCKLIDANLSQNDTRYNHNHNSIFVDGLEFVVSKDFVEEENEDNGYVVTEHGATKKFSRFDNFNKATRSVDNQMTWDNVVSENLDTFYKLNSFLIYSPYDEDTFTNDKEIITNKLARILPNIHHRLVVQHSESSEKETIYEVAIKFRFVFRGEPKYIINKFYFDENYNIFSPSQSKMLYEQISLIVKDANDNKVDNSSDGENDITIESDQVIRITNNILTSMKSFQGFQGYLVGEAKDVFNSYVKDSRSSGQFNIEVACDRAKLRYIAHLKMRLKEYKIIDSQSTQELFLARVGINGDLDLICARCGTTIVNQDVVDFIKVGANGKESIGNAIVADLTDTDIANSVVSKHCMLPPSTCKSCNMLLCKELLSTCAECGKAVCVDCNMNNIVDQYIVDNKVNYYHTACGVYCEDTFQTLPKSYSKRCGMCGKVYTATNFAEKSNMCSLCSPIYSDEIFDDEEYKTMYKINKQILPIHLRGKNNLCNENFDSILFKVVKGKSEHVYHFDKAQLFANKPLKLTKIH